MKLNTHLITSGLRGVMIGLAAASLASYVARATPYASSITNDGSGNMSFYLNEDGGTVTVVYEDNTTNANYNGTTTQTAGAHTFALGAHTSYTIYVNKQGAGAPALIKASAAFTPRGIDVNKHPASKYFGRVYADASGAGGIFVLNPDMSFTFSSTARAAGVSWSNNGFSPYRCYVADDDYLMVGDCSETSGGNGALNDGVWRIDPDVTTGTLFLGPRGYTAGLSAGVHTTIGSRPILLGNPQTGSVLLDVDSDWLSGSGRNSILVYSNITVASLPWQNPPDIQGPEVGLNIASQTLGGNAYPGLQVGPNGYIYASTYRLNYSNPLLQIYQYDPNSASLVQIWNSYYNGATADYFYNPTVVGNAIIDIAVSADGRYVAGAAINNWFYICPMTNGIPDVGNLFYVQPTSTTGNGRAIAFDAADNLYLSSSGLGLCQSWTLGITSTAITTGNGSGSTGFTVLFPSTQANVVATTPNASQGGSNGTAGTPVPGVFTITRTNANNDYTAPVTINFTLGGTATNGVYTTIPAGLNIPATTATPSNNTVILPAGVLSTNISIVPSTANVPRLTTTVVLSVKGGASYSVIQPFNDTVYIQNTSSNLLVVSAAASTMYKAFAADFGSMTITRVGDTNAPAYTIPAAAFTYSGSAVPNVDFVPFGDVTFNPGDLTQTPTGLVLSNGVPPVDVSNPAYAGNKSVTVTVNSQPQYLLGSPASTLLTIIDNAYPPSTVLFTDPLTDPADASHWGVNYTSGNPPQEPDDYSVEFGYDLTANNPESGNNGLIGLPPSGATSALRITCNKTPPSGLTWAGGVNVYYTNQAFSSNYAVRFNMNLVEGNSSLYAVEGPLFGINHNGRETNWFLGGGVVTNGPWASDGVWYWIQAPPGGSGGFAQTDFQEYTGASALPNTGWTQLATAGATTYSNVFKREIFSAPGGVRGGTPANNSPVSASPSDNNWADVEIKQINNVVTMSVDKTPIFVYTNTTTFTNGFLMLGYNCPYQGAFNQFIGTPDASVYFSNLRVVSLANPAITAITAPRSGANNNVTIQFVSHDGDDSAASFALQGASTVNGAYADVSGATIAQIYDNSGLPHFQATVTSASAVQFYRVRHK